LEASFSAIDGSDVGGTCRDADTRPPDPCPPSLFVPETFGRRVPAHFPSDPPRPLAALPCLRGAMRSHRTRAPRRVAGSGARSWRELSLVHCMCVDNPRSIDLCQLRSFADATCGVTVKKKAPIFWHQGFRPRGHLERGGYGPRPKCMHEMNSVFPNCREIDDGRHI
jgi:hypothetical protein